MPFLVSPFVALLALALLSSFVIRSVRQDRAILRMRRDQIARAEQARETRDGR